jgi:peptide deformylase
VAPSIRLLGEPVLHTPAAPVGDVADPAVQAVIDDLLASMRGTGHSVGVAAPQLGVGLRVAVVDVTGHAKARSCHGELVLVNPEVVLAEGPVVGREGCMSVPDLTGEVVRASRVVVRALDRHGVEHVVEADEFEARALQHELDHLEGRLFLDRLVAADRVFRRKVYR